ncbi:MAG: germination protein YpeB, partial [Clostridia bacterium]|nr:germination protein YpeB [Clostridia bacterium]
MTNDTIAKHRIIYWILAIIIAILAIFSGYLYTQKKSLETAVENNYNRAFHELVSYVDDIDTLLQKSMLVSSAAQMSTISSDLFRQTSAAKACLGQLPISEVQLEATEKFLSQVGDYTYSLSQNVINSKKVSDKDYESLKKLGNYATSLNNNLLKMQEDIYNGDISFGTIKRNSK